MRIRGRYKHLFWISLACLVLNACASTQRGTTQQKELSSWIDQALEYENTLDYSHPHRQEQIFSVSNEMRDTLNSEFSEYSKVRAIRELATWLLAADGHAMSYDVNANFSPIDAYREKRGNCLTFTLLVTSMAKELGIDMQFNEVDLPDVWDMDESNGMVLYRHINAVFRTRQRELVFDLAMEEYDSRFPQRTITARQALALLHNNFAIDALRLGDLETATHHMKLAVGANRNNSDIWGNIGVLFSRNGDMKMAEQALLHAMRVDEKNSAAASNLERLYRERGDEKRASHYYRLASRARFNNPYYQYNQAKYAFDEKNFRVAKKAIKRAKRLHDKDSRFFILSGAIEKELGRYNSALKEIEVAHNLSNDVEERGRFEAKALLVARLMLEKDALRQQRDIRFENSREIR